MKTKDFDYYLPEELIAQTPLEKRDESRLMCLDKETGELSHHHFYELPDFLNPGDCLILNNSRVLPARLLGQRLPGGGACEVLLLIDRGDKTWECIVRPGKHLRKGTKMQFGNGELKAEVVDVLPDGNRMVKFDFEGIFLEVLEHLGKMPLPPYIKEELQDQERYQTVYSKVNGSAAAPTAGLHFTPELLEKIQAKGVNIGYVTLHVGLGTFRPVKEDDIEQHDMHSEYCVIPPETATLINETKARGGRVICVGTTSCRTLESWAQEDGHMEPSAGWTSIYIYPGYRFKVMDALVTNFHLPQSTLIMLVSALAGREHVLHAYEEAVKERYRFFSFGDAMFVSWKRGRLCSKVIKYEGKARRGKFKCAHGGKMQTPVFMNTSARRRPLRSGDDALDLKDLGCQIELSNTYHLHLRPGDDVVRQMGGLHKFMHWDGPILTDSGGFQVFSLAGLRKIKEEGVTFASHLDGRRIFMGPEESMRIQSNLGSDIAMAFDECVENPARYEYAKASCERTLRWLERCKIEHDKLNTLSDTVNPQQMLFGINQGATFEDLRIWHMKEIAKLDCDGYAIGGLAVGEPTQTMYDIIDAVEPYMPQDKPRYLMGVGTPSNIIEGVARGVDFFDCVMPARNARHGKLFTWSGSINLKNEKYKLDEQPIDEQCDCPTCRNFSRAYLRHLFKAEEILALRLAVMHNLYFYNKLTQRIRDALDAGEFEAFREAYSGKLSERA